MTEKQTSSARTEHVEYLSSNITDDTPLSSSDESVGDKEGQNNIEEKQSTRRGDDEGLCKFEKEAINKILAIKSEVEKIREVIESAEKEELETNFKMYEEILISKTITLDAIQTKGVEKIKEMRKDTIVFVQECLNLLDLNRK